VHGLAKSRADASELDHQPLDDVVAFGGVRGQEAAELLGEVHQDRARLEHRVGLAARPLVIDDHRNLAVGIDRKEFRLELLALPDVDRDRTVRGAEFLQHDEDLLHVGARQHVEIDHDRASVLRERHPIGEVCAGQEVAHA
jgi:hypothetical protein